MLASSGSLALLYAERLLNGVTPQNYARLARPGGVTIQSNHPAFVLGHLALYPPRVMQGVEKPLPRIVPPATYEPLFTHGAECRDDADGTLYPSLDELRGLFFDGYRAAVEAVAAAPDEILLRPNPTAGRMRELFPTLGAMLGFYLSGHVQNHLGQLSAWRRALGMAAA